MDEKKENEESEILLKGKLRAIEAKKSESFQREFEGLCAKYGFALRSNVFITEDGRLASRVFFSKLD
jgi:hypothetical protein